MSKSPKSINTLWAIILTVSFYLPSPLHPFFYPRYLEQCMALNDGKEWFVPLFTVQFPEAELCGQSVCRLSGFFLLYLGYLLSRKCCFYLWSIIIIPINVFKKWIRSVLGQKRYLGENVWGSTQTQSRGFESLQRSWYSSHLTGPRI